jgi:hypothetical protein
VQVDLVAVQVTVVAVKQLPEVVVVAMQVPQYLHALVKNIQYA